MRSRVNKHMILIIHMGSSPQYLLKEKLEEKCPNLDIRLETIEVSPNQLKQVLVITRVVKSYTELTGPFDPIKIIVLDDLTYTVYLMFEVLLKGTVSAAEEFLLLPILEKIVNDSQWSVCNGVSNCSYYCHYKIHDSVPMFFPTNSVRHKDCPKLFKPASN